MGKNNKILFSLSLILGILFSFSLLSQDFATSEITKSRLQFEMGYQRGFFDALSKNVNPTHSTTNGLFFLHRQYPALAFLSFGAATKDSSQSDYITAGLEIPLFYFPLSKRNKEFGFMISGASDYHKWKKTTDRTMPRFEVISLASIGTAYYRIVSQDIDFLIRFSLGMGFANQYMTSQSGSEMIIRSSVHLILPELISDYGLSFSGFFTLSKWNFDNSDLSTNSQQLAFSMGIAF